MTTRARASALRLVVATSCALAVASSSGPARANGRFPAGGQLVVDPSDSRHIVVRATFGLLQSFDTGTTWSWICEQAASADGFQDPEIIVTTGGRVAMGLPDGLAVGDRSGCQWARTPELANTNVIDLVESTVDPATAYAAASVTVNGAFNALIAKTNDGTTWSPQGALLPDTYPLTIEIAPSSPDRLYLGADDGNLEIGLIVVSDDGGLTWTRRASPAGVDAVYVSAVDPQDPDRVYVRSYFPNNSLYVSEDAAVTWSLIAESNTPFTGFALSPNGRTIAVGGTSGVSIIDRSDGPGGSTYAVSATNPLSVGCLTWTANGLFACTDQATAGFAIAVSSDGGGTFAPLLRLGDLTLAACSAGTSAVACSAVWCSTASVIDASCSEAEDAAPDSTPDSASDGGRAATSSSGGCSCATVGSSRRGEGAIAALATLGALLSLSVRCRARRPDHVRASRATSRCVQRARGR